jgi:hypothetical protein
MTRTANATYAMKLAALIKLAADGGHPFTCSICGKPIIPGQRFAFDHSWAVGRGGPNTVDDIFPVHDEKTGELDCHTRKTAHPRGPHTAICGDTFEAAKTGRLADKFVPQKRPLDTVIGGIDGRCRRCGHEPCQCQVPDRRSAFAGRR